MIKVYFHKYFLFHCLILPKLFQIIEKSYRNDWSVLETVLDIVSVLEIVKRVFN